MADSNRLRLDDVRCVFRLVGEVAELRLQPEAQLAHLAQGAVDLTRSNHGYYVRFGGFTRTDPIEVLQMVVGGHPPERMMDLWQYWSSVIGSYDLREDLLVDGFSKMPAPERVPYARRRREVVSDEAWKASSAYTQFTALAKIDDIMCATSPRQEPGQVNGFALHRLDSDPDYTLRERRLLVLLNEEVMRLYQRGKLSGAGTIERSLSPRQVQLLRSLLLGKAPKGIAYELGLTVATVRTYIRDLYRRIGVSGREELMARYIREGGIDGPAGADAGT